MDWLSLHSVPAWLVASGMSCGLFSSGSSTPPGARASEAAGAQAAAEPPARRGPPPAPAPVAAEESPGGMAMIDIAPAIEKSRVVIGAYALDRTEVSAREYRKCMLAGKCSKPADDTRIYTIDAEWGEDKPVNGVSRDQAMQFCAWAGKRLPTSQEWLWAAQGRDEKRRHPWGAAPPSCDKVHMIQLADADAIGCAPAKGPPGIAEVGTHPQGATRDGLLDMAGNVGEWTSSDRSSSLAWVGTWEANVALTWERPEKRSHLIGFRCAQDRPMPDLPGVIGHDGVLVSEVFVDKGDPWPQDNEDFQYGCYLGEGGIEALRVRRVGTNATLTTYAWDGSSYPPNATPIGEVTIKPGTIVEPKAQRNLVIADAAYYVRKSANCGLVDDFEQTGERISLVEGDIAYLRYGYEDTAECVTSTARWGWCEPEAYDPSPDDDPQAAAARRCYREALEPIKTIRPPEGALLGWWFELEQGWVHADPNFVLDVKCDDCFHLVEACYEEKDCETEACFDSCKGARDGCVSKWGSPS